MKLKIKPKQAAIGAGSVAVTALATFLLVGFLNKSAAKSVVRESLKDPESAIFGEYSKIGDAACLTVNAKNSMGGYTGAQQALLTKDDGEWTVSGIDEISHSDCIALLKEKSDAAAGHSDLCKELKRSIALQGDDKEAVEKAKSTAKQWGCAT